MTLKPIARVRKVQTGFWQVAARTGTSWEFAGNFYEWADALYRARWIVSQRRALADLALLSDLHKQKTGGSGSADSHIVRSRNL